MKRRWKKALALVVALVMLTELLPLTAWAEGTETTATSGECGENVRWEFDETTGTLTISGEGEMRGFGGSSAPWFGKWSDHITKIVIEKGVTSIGYEAFNGCRDLVSVNVADSVKTIGSSAFSGCVKLKDIIIPDGVTDIGSVAFRECSSLKNITIPNSVTSIGSSSFDGCSALESITLPENMKMIGTSAFNGCSSLKSIKIPTGITKIDGHTFQGCNSLTDITIPEGVEIIESNAFSGCSALTNVELPDSVTRIEEGIFSGCSSLTSIAIPEKVKIITGGSHSSGVFSNCSNLTEVTLPDGLTQIGGYAFSGCSSLTEITIPENVESIGASAFRDCSSLTEIAVPSGVDTIGGRCFYGCSSLTKIKIPPKVQRIEEETFAGCSGLTNIVIPDDVSYIGAGAFRYCSSLTSIAIPKNVQRIEAGTFLGCANLTKIELPDSVESIGVGAFHGCSSLTNIAIPKNVQRLEDGGFLDSGTFSDCSSLTKVIIPDGMTYIGAYTFKGCSSLANVTIPNSVTTIGDSAFQYCMSLKTITIPDSVTSIGQYAFKRDILWGNEGGLTDIYYTNTEKQWNQIKIGTQTIPEGVIIHCIDGILGEEKPDPKPDPDPGDPKPNPNPDETEEDGTIVGAFGQYDAQAHTLTVDEKTYTVSDTYTIDANTLSGQRVFALVQGGKIVHMDALENIGLQLEVMVADEPLKSLTYTDGELNGNLTLNVTVAGKLSYDFPAGYNQAVIAADSYFQNKAIALQSLTVQPGSADFVITVDESAANATVSIGKPWQTTLTVAPRADFVPAEGSTVITDNRVTVTPTQGDAVQTSFRFGVTSQEEQQPQPPQPQPPIELNTSEKIQRDDAKAQQVNPTLAAQVDSLIAGFAPQVTLPQDLAQAVVTDTAAQQRLSHLLTLWLTAVTTTEKLEPAAEQQLQTIFDRPASGLAASGSIRAHVPTAYGAKVIVFDYSGGKLSWRVENPTGVPASSRSGQSAISLGAGSGQFATGFCAALNKAAQDGGADDAYIFDNVTGRMVNKLCGYYSDGLFDLVLNGKKELTISGPVNVVVYDGSGAQCASMMGKRVDGNNVALSSRNAEDKVITCSDDDYQIVLTGIGDGKANYTIREYAGKELLREVAFTNLPAATGKFYSGAIPLGAYTVREKYRLTDENGAVIEPTRDTTPSQGGNESTDKPSSDLPNGGGSTNPPSGDNSGGYDGSYDYDGGDNSSLSSDSNNSSSSGSGGSSATTPQVTPAKPTSATTVSHARVMGSGTFVDVSPTDWYYTPVKYVYDKSIMTGTAAAIFSPDATTTRAMVVSILHRLEKNPQVSTRAPFDDVADDAYYAKAVAWAAANGLASGYDGKTFGAEDAITREQLAAILQRYAAYKGYDTNDYASLSAYQDAGQISHYAFEPMQWAVAKGFITGMDDATLAPQNSATRAQVAAIIMRWCQQAER